MIKAEFSKPAAAETVSKARAARTKLLARQDLGYLRLPERSEVWGRSQEYGFKLRRQADHLVVCGMGGSSLGGKALVDALGARDRVLFLNNTDPEQIREFFNNESALRRSHFLVVSKSGNTLEVAAFLSLIHEYLKKAHIPLRQAVTVITEPRSNPLYNWSMSEDVVCLPHPIDVGGRFSVFSEVGLVPAAFSGVNIEDLRHGARAAIADEELAVKLSAAYLESFARGESISVFWSYAWQFDPLLPWLQQLWAESLGKAQNRLGQKAPGVSTPFAATGTCDQHSVLQQMMEGARDKMVLFLRSAEHAGLGPTLTAELSPFSYINGKNLGEVFQIQSEATESALKEARVPTLNLTVERTDTFHFGKLLMLFELVVGVLGEALDINAFDQPGVELGKKIAKARLEESSRI